MARGPSHLVGFGDTHNKTIVYPSSPIVSAALAVGEAMRATGRDFLTAVIGGTPEQFAAYIRNEIVKWARVIKESGARAE